METKIPLIAVVGPTASGKTALSVELAKHLDGEIVSADSMQIYRSMPVAAAVPTEDERQGIPHFLMEILPPECDCTVADYVNLAKSAVNDIYSRGKQPILVGGTGLYVNSLVNNTVFSEHRFDPQCRRLLEREFDEVGGKEMLKRLAEFDADTAEHLHENDRRRIIRAFEVYRQTGKTVTEQNRLSREHPSPYDTVMIGITFRDRQRLYDRINLRVDNMLECGLLDEARRSFEQNRGGSAQAIGHKELFPFLRGECTLYEAVEVLKRETRRYAKRQLTWFRRDTEINWIYADEEDVFESALKILGREKNEG